MTDPVAVTRATYDTIAVEYERRTRTPFAGLADDVDAFASALPVSALVADVGCGPGRDAALLSERGPVVVRLDLSLAMLRMGDRSRAVQADMRALPLRSDSLDGVWCQAAMLHVPLADAPLALAEFGRVVRRDGVLYLAVAEGDGEGWQTDVHSGEHRWFAHHRVDSLSALLAGAGFSVRDVTRRSSHRDWLVVRARRR
ncbi:MAG TPA: class I SAM-dependent methyltransferase [Micromonosporaceae bacterium]